MSVPAAFVGVILIWATTPLAIKWSGEGVSFSGTAGAIRQAGQKWTVAFFEPGEATMHGKHAKAETPQEVAP